MEVRNKFYSLITNCIPPEMIFKKLAATLIKKVDLDLQHQIAHWSAFYVCIFNQQ